MNTASLFFPESLVARARSADSPWAEQARSHIVAAAKYWYELDDAALWELPVGHRISRAWQVWSNGHCPSCLGDVREYDWIIEPFIRPWKVKCPHCAEVFPKNDFETYYQSALDDAGEYDGFLGDPALLVREDAEAAAAALATNPADEKAYTHAPTYGVDDGEGFTIGDKRWRFINAFLTYGRWKQLVVAGVHKLADAWVVTGDMTYARKAAILLDRIADLHPRMIFATQGLVYETRGHRGFQSVWHDAAVEIRDLALAFDAIRPGLVDNQPLIDALSAQATKYRLPSPKDNLAAILNNIESNLLQHTLDHKDGIQTNFPNQPITMLLIRSVLDWDTQQEKLTADLDELIESATRIDGTTGEKGTPGYSSIGPSNLADLLERFTRAKPGFFENTLKRHPQLRDTWRFHIDIWCLQKYYPSCGDGGWFANPAPDYAGVSFDNRRGLASDEPSGDLLAPSMYTFLWRVFTATGDPAFAQVVHHANAGQTEGLPFDLFAENDAAVQHDIASVVDQHGPTLNLPSVDKPAWALAVLRSGQGDHARAAWLDYDSGWSHSHYDALNLGLFALGLDLLPDLGYTPTSYGGHETPQAIWYIRAPSHNTIVVDGRNHDGARWGHNPRTGKTTMFHDGETVQLVAADARPCYEKCSQYERTVAMIRIDEKRFYLFDVARVAGGHDHARFFHSHYATLTTEGLSTKPAPDWEYDQFMRNFATDEAPSMGWSAEWKIFDRYNLREPGADVRLRLTDLTENAAASTCESWIVAGGYNSTDEVWIPKVMTRRQSETDDLATTFVAVLEPYEDQRSLANCQRVDIVRKGDNTPATSDIAASITLADGRTDLLIVRDVLKDEASTTASPSPLIASTIELETDAAFVLLRLSPDGQRTHLTMVGGSTLQHRGRNLTPINYEGQAEVDLTLDR